MSMTQEKMYMNVDDVCAVLGVSNSYEFPSLVTELGRIADVMEEVMEGDRE